jgi:hypothetical protein
VYSTGVWEYVCGCIPGVVVGIPSVWRYRHYGVVVYWECIPWCIVSYVV